MKPLIGITLLILVLGTGYSASSHGLPEVYQLLNVEAPRLLPGSPFYFFKAIGRGLGLLVTFDAVRKAELELRFADEKLAELETLAAQKPDATRALEQALENYLESHQRLEGRLTSLRGKNKNVDRLLEALAKRVIDHQKLFEDLEERISDEKRDELTRELAENAKLGLELNAEKFKDALKKKIKETEEDDLEDFDALEELEEIDEELEELLEDVEEALGDPQRRSAAGGLEEAREEIEEYREEAAGATLDAKNRREADRLLQEADKHWGFAKDAFAKGNYKDVEVHVGHVLGFLGELNSIVSYEKKLKDFEKCGPPPGAPGNWVCKDGGWIVMSEKIACTREYKPVCGVDGKTYGNECVAKVAGVSIKHSGVCGCGVSPPALAAPPPGCNYVGEVMCVDGEWKLPQLVCPKPASQIQEFKIEADDLGFYPAGAVKATRGSKVKVAFLVRQTNVYFGGLDFRSAKFKTDPVKPGESTTVEFVADDNLLITSYWPAASVRKADLRVEVK